MTKRTLVAAAITGIVAAGGMTAMADHHKGGKKGECHGINSCKAKGKCGGKGHSCAGKNACKGKGWLKMSKKDCHQKVLDAAKKKGMFFKG
jgi:uncharacterized membrane protein